MTKKKSAKKGKPDSKPRQARLPGTEDAAIQELESAAEKYAEGRDERMAMLRSEVSMKEGLLALMKKHEKKTYNHAGIEIKIVAKDESVKVRIHKDED